mmetsp:Transcript_3194/g.4809  ORF Transcript_3194/g.4809 Transcript_3194/m.4809 type:complete len:305 (+) Transcript_3194:10126-11040(+)
MLLKNAFRDYCGLLRLSLHVVLCLSDLATLLYNRSMASMLLRHTSKSSTTLISSVLLMRCLRSGRVMTWASRHRFSRSLLCPFTQVRRLQRTQNGKKLQHVLCMSCPQSVISVHRLVNSSTNVIMAMSSFYSAILKLLASVVLNTQGTLLRMLAPSSCEGVGKMFVMEKLLLRLRLNLRLIARISMLKLLRASQRPQLNPKEKVKKARVKARVLKGRMQKLLKAKPPKVRLQKVNRPHLLRQKEKSLLDRREFTSLYLFTCLVETFNFSSTLTNDGAWPLWTTLNLQLTQVCQTFRRCSILTCQ